MVETGTLPVRGVVLTLPERTRAYPTNPDRTPARPALPYPGSPGLSRYFVFILAPPLLAMPALSTPCPASPNQTQSRPTLPRGTLLCPTRPRHTRTRHGLPDALYFTMTHHTFPTQSRPNQARPRPAGVGFKVSLPYPAIAEHTWPKLTHILPQRGTPLSHKLPATTPPEDSEGRRCFFPPVIRLPSGR